MIFRLGVRVDRYDANTRVLKDPFSLYEIIGADDFHANFGGERPGSIGGDYKVYTDVNDGVNVVAYRSGENWFRPDGSPTNSPLEIDALRGLLPTPKYANPAVHEFADFIKSDGFSVDDSFSYTTFDNQDFGTVKGFSLTYDLRRTANFTVNANYTLQFADGTGSGSTSQRGLTNRGNLRTLFPLSFDERHRINLVLDYRVGRNTNLPGIFKDLGANLQTSAVLLSPAPPYVHRCPVRPLILLPPINKI